VDFRRKSPERNKVLKLHRL